MSGGGRVRLTFGVVGFRPGGDAYPGDAHQQSHHQVDGHPGVQDLVLGARRPAEEAREADRGDTGNVRRRSWAHHKVAL